MRHANSTTQIMARSAEARRAMTLLELGAVTIIIGLLGLMAATRYGSAAVADADGQGFARRIALDCSHARRLAIATGEQPPLALHDCWRQSPPSTRSIAGKA